MKPIKNLSKTLLATSIAVVMALSSTVLFAQNDDAPQAKTYTDPMTGELKVAPRLLSDMSEAEIAALSEQEKRFLEDLEAQINKEQQEANK